MDWRPHIDSIVGQAHSKLSFLERNLSSCPKSLKAQAYTTIIRPPLEYASVIWDPSSTDDKKRIDSVQRAAARFVCDKPRKRHADHLPDKDYDYVSVTQLVAECKWPSLESRRKDSRCIFMHKLLTRQVEATEHLIPSFCTGRTRSATQKKLPPGPAKPPLLSNSFVPRTIRDWNNYVPNSARLATTVDDFKAALRSQSASA